jgi:prepilin-type N-terminal cleavage/methylation domain-containing protein
VLLFIYWGVKMSYRRKWKPSITDGFTMIELLVVIAMIGTIAAIAVPSWQGFLDRQRMNAARSDLMGILKGAQDEAQARQQSKRVTFLPYAASTPLSVVVRNESSSTAGVTTLLGDGRLGQKFRLTASTPIVFDHDGRVNVVNVVSGAEVITPLSTPSVIRIRNSAAPSTSITQSCVIVTTLLGGLKPANDNLCN